MQEALIFTDDNEQLRASYAKHVRLASIMLICVGVLCGSMALLGLFTVTNIGAESDDPAFIIGFSAVGIVYGLLAVRKWSHITFAISTMANVPLLVILIYSTIIELLDRVDLISVLCLVVVAAQVLVTGLVAKGLIYAKKLRKLKVQSQR